MSTVSSSLQFVMESNSGKLVPSLLRLLLVSIPLEIIWTLILSAQIKQTETRQASPGLWGKLRDIQGLPPHVLGILQNSAHPDHQQDSIT